MYGLTAALLWATAITNVNAQMMVTEPMNMENSANTDMNWENKMSMDIYDPKVNEFMNILSIKVNQKAWWAAELKAFSKQLWSLWLKKPDYVPLIEAIISRISIDYQWMLGATILKDDPIFKDLISVLNNVSTQDITKEEIVESMVQNINNRIVGVPNTKYAIKIMREFLLSYAMKTEVSNTMKEAIPLIIKELETSLENTAKNELTELNNQLNNVNVRYPQYPQFQTEKLSKPEFTAPAGYTIGFVSTIVDINSIWADIESEVANRNNWTSMITLKSLSENEKKNFSIALVKILITNKSGKDTNYPDNIQISMKDSNKLLHSNQNYRYQMPQATLSDWDSYVLTRYFLLDKWAKVSEVVLTAQDWMGKSYSYKYAANQ